jgi:hypothetical protein
MQNSRPKGYEAISVVRSKACAPDQIWPPAKRYATRSVHFAINAADFILSDLTSVVRSRSNGTYSM